MLHGSAPDGNNGFVKVFCANAETVKAVKKINKWILFFIL